MEDLDFSNIRIEHFEDREFEGVDSSLQKSLFDYGLIWGKNKECEKDEFLFIYKVNDNKFDSGYLSKKDFSYSFYFDDDNMKDIESYTGQSKKELIEEFPNSLYSIFSYYGYSNIFGESYSTFTIFDPEAEFLTPYDIPEFAMGAIFNGDYSGCNDEDEEKINDFLKDFDYTRGHFAMAPDYGIYDKNEFNIYPDIGNLACTTYIVYWVDMGILKGSKENGR